MSYLEQLRAAEKNQERASGGRVKSVKTPPRDPAAPVEPAQRAWLIRHADGSLWSHHFIPPATEREVWAWYPRALAVEGEDDADPGDTQDPSGRNPG
jgi:hypothetical protein